MQTPESSLLSLRALEHLQGPLNRLVGLGELFMLASGNVVPIMHLLVEGLGFVRWLRRTDFFATETLLVSVCELLVSQDCRFVPVETVLEVAQLELGQQSTGKSLNRQRILASPALQIFEPTSMILVSFQMLQMRRRLAARFLHLDILNIHLENRPQGLDTDARPTDDQHHARALVGLGEPQESSDG